LAKSSPPEELFDFPCDYQFKAFGDTTNQDDFCRRVLEAVSGVVPVSPDALQLRPSSGGRYICVTINARIQGRPELEAVYASLRNLKGMRYLL